MNSLGDARRFLQSECVQVHFSKSVAAAISFQLKHTSPWVLYHVYNAAVLEMIDKLLCWLTLRGKQGLGV